jgi:transcription antitermination factor NusG
VSVQWYTFHSQPYKEDLLWQQLQSRNFEGYYPRIRVQTVNPRAKKIKPYFPGYLFIHVDLEHIGISTLQWLPYGTGLVTFGGEPSVISDSLITAIRQRVGEIALAGGELFDGLTHGDVVSIQNGPFSGYEAIFDTRISGKERVRVLLKMLNSRHIPVELDAGQIKKVTKPLHPNGKVDHL